MTESVLEEHDVAFDPSTQHLDLTKEQKRRTTALMLAIQAYRELIIKDADYLREAYAQHRAGDGPQIKPATIDAMVTAAIKFDAFIAGDRQPTDQEIESVIGAEDDPERDGGEQTGEQTGKQTGEQ